MRSAIQNLRTSAIETIPFVSPIWASLAYGTVAAHNLPALKARAERLALQIHRTSRSPLARHVVEPIIRDGAVSAAYGGGGSPANASVSRSRMMVLKPYVSAREPGVLKIMFSETINALPRMPGFAQLSKRYRLVLEPSWTGAAEPGLLQYAKHPDPVVVLAGAETDFEFLCRLDSSMRPIRIGPCDWVDPRRAAPYLGSAKEFDLVLNSTWAPWKRHRVLFQAMARLERKIKVALIGVPWDGGTLDQVMGMASEFGVADQLTVFERVPFDRVMEIQSKSRCAALFSLKEGSNRALAEAMFCDVPVILLDRHWGGITKNVVPATGVITSERQLPATILEIVEGRRTFTPRDWAMRNISCQVSSARLTAFLKNIATERAKSWTEDIRVHSNSPECTYWDPADTEALAEEQASAERLLQTGA